MREVIHKLELASCVREQGMSIVGYWPKADIVLAPFNVRFRG